MIYNMDCIAGAKQHLLDDSIDLLIADPPYNLSFGGTSMTKNKKPRFNIIANDRLHPRDYQRFTYQWLREAYRVLKAGRHIYVFIDWRMYPLLYLWMQRVGFVIKNCVVWNKVNMGMGWQYRYQHEFVIFAVKGKNKARRVSNRRATDNLDITANCKSKDHSSNGEASSTYGGHHSKQQRRRRNGSGFFPWFWPCSGSGKQAWP